ncbi:MAG: ABC transporter ATP-binding protein [Armatimonadota bacterium]|nr:ABC transporter ATP-binding protein [Armatimonadota bacterium]MDR5703412.1 ABC transporter ATP-binding protein [Armatimonadota bacterium]MDR7434844.1 ABC transporter ATP-binding protein [Armatimonadota bacterium]
MRDVPWSGTGSDGADTKALVVEGLDVSYGDAKVLFGVSLRVEEGQLVACVGRNGAGKTTLLRTIAGFLRPSAGRIRYGDVDLVGWKPYEIARLGIRYVQQDKRVFSDLTVRENLELASYATGDRNWDIVFHYFPKLKELLDRKGGYLSGGERQMLMIGRALLGNPKVLLIDEPTEGLAPSIVELLRDVFRELKKSSSVVIVEQNLPLVADVADKVYAVKEGRIAAEISDAQAIKGHAYEQYL